MSDNAKEAAEQESILQAASLAPRQVYEVIRREGSDELSRPAISLVWSGLAAGIMIGVSVLAESVLHTWLPAEPWRPLVASFGYSLGFLIVILGRMQLFTENTLTTVLPVMSHPNARMFGSLARLWIIVLTANVAGAVVVAAAFALTPVVSPEFLPAMTEVSLAATGSPAGTNFALAVPAGVLVAAIVWMLPQAVADSFFVITVFTWLIAVCGFTHVIAGSVEIAFLVIRGDAGLPDAVFGFFLPTLAGNIVGGTVIFALMARGQVRKELVAEL